MDDTLTDDEDTGQEAEPERVDVPQPHPGADSDADSNADANPPASPNARVDVPPPPRPHADAGTDADPEAPRLTLGEHLEDLRASLLRVALGVGVVAVTVAVFYRVAWAWVMIPRTRAAAWLGQPAEEAIPILMTRPFEGLAIVAGLMLKIGLIAASPVVVFEIWRFVSPGLKREERRAALPILTFGTGMFFLGVAVAFFYAVPLGLQFLVRFNQTLPGATTMYTMQEYTSFVTMACLGFGVAFETPLVMMALARVRLIRPQGILRAWRHVLLGTLVAGAVLTPPDPVTQLLLACILLVLFLLGYILARWVYPNPLPNAPPGT